MDDIYQLVPRTNARIKTSNEEKSIIFLFGGNMLIDRTPFILSVWMTALYEPSFYILKLSIATLPMRFTPPEMTAATTTQIPMLVAGSGTP